VDRSKKGRLLWEMYEEPAGSKDVRQGMPLEQAAAAGLRASTYYGVCVCVAFVIVEAVLRRSMRGTCLVCCLTSADPFLLLAFRRF